MRLQPKREDFTVQKEFLHTTQGLIHKVGGLTLKASAFTPDATGHVKAGSGVMIDATGFAVPPTFDATTGAPGGELFVTANDVNITDGDAIVGALEEGYLNESVVTTAETGRVVITDQFITGAGNRFKLR